MELPARKSADLIKAFRRFNGEQKLAQLIGHRAGYTLCIVVVMQGLKPSVANPAEMHVSPSLCMAAPYIVKHFYT
jgi:hypothetical protein